MDPEGAVPPQVGEGAGGTAVVGAAPVVGDADREAGLSRREHEMLAFERQWWRHAGAKETAIRERFDLAPTRYYQALNALVEKPAALAADPLLVRRLRRLRAARGQRRSSHLLGNDNRVV